MNITQYYHTSHIRTNFPTKADGSERPNRTFQNNYLKHVKTLEQIDAGDFAIPLGYFGTSFFICEDQPCLNSDGDISPYTLYQTSLFVKLDDFYSLQRVKKIFGSDNKLYRDMLANTQDCIIKMDKNDFGLPVNYSHFIGVEGNDFQYKILGCIENPSFNKPIDMDGIALAKTYLNRKAFFEKTFSMN